MVRKEFREHQAFLLETILLEKGYCILLTSDANIETINGYIEQQDTLQ